MAKPRKSDKSAESAEKSKSLQQQPLSIKFDDAIDELIRAGAALSKASVTDIVRDCVEESLDRVLARRMQARPRSQKLLERLMRLTTKKS
jgi:hypothetical protein